MTTPNPGQQPAPAAAPPAETPPTDQSKTIESLTQKVAEQEALIGKLRGIEANLSKAAKRGERMEAIARSQLDMLRPVVPQAVQDEVKDLPLDKQWSIFTALAAGTPPPEIPTPQPPQEATPLPQAPQQPPTPQTPQAPAAAPTTPTRRPAGASPDPFEVEKAQLQQQGRLNGQTLMALIRKHHAGGKG